MSRRATVRTNLAASAVLALVAGGVAAPALADPGKGQGQGQGGASASAPGQVKDKDKDKKDKPGKPSKGAKGDGAKGHQGDPGHQGQGHGPKGDKGPKGSQGGNSNGQGQGGAQGPKGDKGPKGGGQGDPGGNNGTVKIAGLGELDGIPNNTPHPGCTFQVEWYGFDEGDDVVSQVSFAMHAPTADVGLSVAGDTSVFVGGDPASGAGTDSGLDGVETYTLSFDGEPHPKQGYHVKLTVATPRSHGNDTKTKVFWVEPCETAPAEETSEETSGGTSGEQSSGEQSSGEQSSGDTENGVLGTNAETTQNELQGAAENATSAEEAAVPTRVDAGEDGTFDSFGGFVSSPLGLMIAGLGVLLAAAGVLARRRSGDTPTI